MMTNRWFAAALLAASAWIAGCGGTSVSEGNVPKAKPITAEESRATSALAEEQLRKMGGPGTGTTPRIPGAPRTR